VTAEEHLALVKRQGARVKRARANLSAASTDRTAAMRAAAAAGVTTQAIAAAAGVSWQAAKKQLSDPDQER
jgi:hypothetical protein